MRDWRIHPAWGPVALFLGVLLGLLSLFPPAPLIVKILVITAVLGASVFTIFYKPKPPWTQYSRYGEWVTETWGSSSYPASSEKKNRKWLGRFVFLYHKHRIVRFLIISVIVGLPGVLLVLSSVLWQHIIGIILLIVCGIAGLLTLILPERPPKRQQPSNDSRELDPGSL